MTNFLDLLSKGKELVGLLKLSGQTQENGLAEMLALLQELQPVIEEFSRLDDNDPTVSSISEQGFDQAQSKALAVALRRLSTVSDADLHHVMAVMTDPRYTLVAYFHSPPIKGLRRMVTHVAAQRGLNPPTLTEQENGYQDFVTNLPSLGEVPSSWGQVLLDYERQIEQACKPISFADLDAPEDHTSTASNKKRRRRRRRRSGGSRKAS